MAEIYVIPDDTPIHYSARFLRMNAIGYWFAQCDLAWLDATPRDRNRVMNALADAPAHLAMMRAFLASSAFWTLGVR